MNMIVSIIIPTYNSALTICECIESIKLQKYEGLYEIVVVDNGSNDDTVEKIKKMGIKQVIMSPNTTVYGSRNLGVKKSKGDIIAFIDSDCTASNEWLLSGVKKIETYDIVAGKIIPKKSDNMLLYYYDKYILRQEVERDINNVNIAAGNAFIRRDVFERLNGFREDIITGGDSVFSMMAKINGYKIIYSEKAIVSHPVDSIVRKIRGIFREGAGAEIKKPYKYINTNFKENLIIRTGNMIEQYVNDMKSIYRGWKKKDIDTIMFLQLIFFALFMRTFMYIGTLSSKYFKSVTELLSRR